MGNKDLRPTIDSPMEGFNDQQLQYLTEKFEVLQDENGFLSQKLFCQIYKCSEEEAAKFIKFIDNSENGEIDLYEFKCAAASLHQNDDQAERLLYEVYSTQGEIKQEHFQMLYKTIISYLNDMNIIQETYTDQIGKTKFIQYDYNKNGQLDHTEFSEMLKNDVHCKKWMAVLGFVQEDIMAERVEKPDLEEYVEADQFKEDDNQGDRGGSTPAWIKTINYMAAKTKPSSSHNMPPSSNLGIQHVYGYRSYDTRDNLKYNPKGEAVYHTAGLGIVLNQGKNTMKTMDLHNDDITCLDVRDNITVTAEMGKRPLIVVWDNETMEKIATFSAPLERSIACVAISPSKKYIAASSMCDTHDIAVYDIEKQKLVASGKGPKSVIYSLKFSESEDVVAASCAKQVVFADFKNGNLKVTNGSFGKNPAVAAFSLARYSNGFVSGMQNGSIIVWKGTGSGKAYKQHTTAVSALSQTPKGGIISGDVGGNIVIWTNNLLVERKLMVSKLINTPSNNPKVIAFCCKDSNVLIGTRGGEIIQANLSKNPASGAIIMEGHFDKELWGLASSKKSNEFFTVGQDKLLLKWDMPKRKLTGKLKLPFEAMSVDVNRDSSIVAVGMRNGIVMFYDYVSLKEVGKKIVNYKNPDKEVLSLVKYSPDSSIIAVAYCPPVSKVLLYDTKTYKKVGQCKGCVSRITCLDFTTDSDRLMLNTTSYEILFFGSDGKHITNAQTFVSDSYEEDVFDTLSCKFSWQAQGVWPHLHADASNINCVERSNDRRFLASGDDFSKIKLFNYPACFVKQSFNQYKGHSSHITGVKWAPKDEYMISIGGLEKSIIQWKLDNQEQICYEADEDVRQQEAEDEEDGEEGEEKDQFAEDEDEGDRGGANKNFLGEVKNSTPAEFANPIAQKYDVLPAESLKINYAWGIRNQYISDQVRNQLKYTESGKSCVYFTAALGVEMNIEDQSQQFYNEQSQDLISMSITPDRKTVATGQMAQVDKLNKRIPKVSIHVWSVDEKKQLKELKGFHQRAIVILEFSPDGSQLLSIGQDERNTMAVYNWKGNKILWQAPTSKGKATGACWKNNTQYCTIGTDHIKFWTQGKGTMGKVPGKWESMYSVAFLDGIKYVSGGSSGGLFLWSGGKASKIEAHKGKVHSIKVMNGKSVYTGAEDGKIISWKFNGKELSKVGEIADIGKVAPLSPGVLSIDIHPTMDRMLVCTKSSEIYEFPTNKFGENKCLMKSHFAGELWCCCISPDNDRFVTGGDDKTIRVYDIETHSQLSIANTTNIIRAVDWSRARPQLIVAGDWQGIIYLYNANSKGEELEQLDIGQTKFTTMKKQASTFWIEDIKFSPDGESVAFGAHGGRSHIEVFKINGNKFGKSSVLNVGFSSALLTLDWNLQSTVIAATSQAYEFKFANPLGKGNEASIRSSSMKNEKWDSWSSKFGWMVQGIHFDPNYSKLNAVGRDNSESLIATGSDDQKVRIFKYPVLADKQKHKQYIGHSSHVTRVRFSNDECYLLSTGGNDRTTILWDVIRPNKPKKELKKNEEEQEEVEKGEKQEEEAQDEEEEEEVADDEEEEEGEEGEESKKSKVKGKSKIKKTQESTDFDDGIDIPASAAEQLREDVEDDEFKEDDNEGDRFGASKPWKGALKDPSIPFVKTDGRAPKAKIQKEYAYGYRTKDCRNNLKFITNDTISYHTAGLGIVMNIAEEPQQQKFFDKHTDDILSMCWSESKLSIFTGEQGPHCLAHEWDSDGQFIKTYKGMIKGIVALACNDDYLVGAGLDVDHSIMVWSRKDGKKVAETKGGPDYIVALEFVDRDSFVSAGIKHYKLWKIQDKKLTGVKGSFKSNNNLLACAKRKGDSILAGAADGTLQVWKGTSITSSKKLHGGKPLEAICCLEDVVLTGGKDKKINILDNKFNVIQTIDCEKLLKGSVSAQVRAIDVLGNRMLVGTIASEIFEVKCSDPINQAKESSKFTLKKCRMSGHYAANTKWTNQVWGLSIKSDEEFVTCSDDSTVRIWNMNTREQVEYQKLDLDKKQKSIPRNKLTGDFEESAKGRAVAVSNDGYILVGCKQGTLRVFDSKLKQVDIIKVAKKQISDVKISADNTLVAIGAHDSVIYMYDYKEKGSLKYKTKMTKHTSTITHIDFSKDGNYLHSNSRDYELLFWDTNTGSQITSGATQLKNQFFHTWTSCIGWPVQGIWQLCSKGTDINAVDRTKEQNPYEGSTLLCLGDDFGKVRLLSYPVLQKNAKSVDGKGHSSHVTCVRWTEDDERIISTGGEDHTIIQWRVDK